jgi:glycosyltransferase involved in cell wall biosynthesis
MTSKPRLLYVVTEDWFFCSHFLAMAQAAKDAGFDITVACRVRDHGEQIQQLGYHLIPTETDRSSLNPFNIIATIWRMRRLIRSNKPDIIHLIALRSVIIGGTAARLAGVKRRIIALTGMGLVGASKTPLVSLFRRFLRTYIRTIIDGYSAHFLFENRTDPLVLGLEPDDRFKTTILGGAGVDTNLLQHVPLTTNPPVKLAFVGRMQWSKGVDLAVEAVSQARAKGFNVTLSLYGKPDPMNPKAIAIDQLHAWNEEPGINWHGEIKQDDVAGIWANHHAAILASRGGEGLPRSLLEAASCGRAIITTDVPGCRDLVRDGIEGFVVPSDNAEALAKAIENLCQNPALVETMGKAARARILEGYTTQHIAQTMRNLYTGMINKAG